MEEILCRFIAMTIAIGAAVSLAIMLQKYNDDDDSI